VIDPLGAEVDADVHWTARSLDASVNCGLQFVVVEVLESATFRRWIRRLRDRSGVARIKEWRET